MAETQGGGAVVGAGWGWLAAAGVAALLLGILALLFPVPATFLATAMAAGLFLATGVFALVGAAQAHGHHRRGHLIGYGLLALVAGVLLLVFPISGAVALTTVATAWLAARGVLEIIAGVRSSRGRALLIVLGVVNLLLATMVWLHLPWAALTLPGVLLGASFVFGGAAELSAAFAYRRGTPAFAAR